MRRAGKPMGIIYCGSYDCIHCNPDNNICDADEVFLNTANIMTAWEGRQDFWRCKQYEISEKTRRLYEQFEKFLKEQGLEAL